MRALWRGNDPITSIEAALSLGDVTKLEALVYKCLHDMPDGGTSEEIAKKLDLSRVTISPRLRPLANKGLIFDTELKRPGESGRSGIVWDISASSDLPTASAGSSQCLV